MATRKPSDTKPDDRLPGEADMARVYRAAAQDTPPAALDARILAASQHALSTPKTRGLFGARWAIPFSTAAVIVLSLGVVLLLSEQGALNHRDMPVPMAAEAPLEAPARSVASALPTAEAPAKPKSPLSENAQGMAAGQTVRPSTPAAKKTEHHAALPAAAPALDVRTDLARVEINPKNKLAKEANGMGVLADVISVQTSGQPGAYHFKVGIRSPDKGCSQYANWWEVVSADGKLLYRRVLLHSHVDEQPFARAGGPVPIQAESVVWVRAHMHNAGYGGAAFKGSVKTGFARAEPADNFAAALAQQPPLPDGCDF